MSDAVETTTTEPPGPPQNTEQAAPLPRASEGPRWSQSPFVTIAGRTFPRATGAERLAWCALLVVVLTVLGIATQLTPDARGMGTHEQIPFFGGHMKPCGFAYVTGIPCPSCGYTTTFALAAHGHFWGAIKNQPFGFVVFLVACALVPLSVVAVLGKVSWARATDDWPWKRIVLVAIALWLLAWTYKIEMMATA